MRTFVLATLLAMVASWATAQSLRMSAQTMTAQRLPGTSARLAPARPPSPPLNSIRSLPPVSDFARFRGFRHENPFQSLLFPFGIFPDSSYSDYPSYSDNPSPGPGLQEAQSGLLMQALAALGTNQQQPPESNSRSLLIELQGDRYVNLTNAETAPNSPEPTIVPRALTKEPGEKMVSTRDLLPVTLFFRDGHSEEVRDYTIADGTIYARGNLYSDGYWNKKIALSDLDLRETIESNQARGVHFVLPSSPNEVITRP